MKTNRALGWLLAVSLGALAAPSLIGCGGVVTYGGGNGDGGAGGDDGAGGDGGQGGGLIDPGSGGAGGVGGSPAPGAIAMNHSQLEAATNSGSGGSSGTTGGAGGGPDGNTQYLMFGGGTESPTCGAPYGSGQCGGWRTHISVAPSLFQPGIVSFADPGLDITVFESMDEGNGMCSGGGGGGFEEGELEILEITPTSVRFVVSGVTSFFEQDPNGERIAQRCP